MGAAIEGTSVQDVYIGKRNKGKRLTVILALLAIALAALTFLVLSWTQIAGADEILSRESIRLSTVTRGNLRRKVTAQGRIVVANSPTLFASEQGYIDLRVKAGDPVRGGQVLAVIASPELGELLAREQSNLAKIQADLAQQQIESKQRRLALEQALALAKVELKAMEREKQRSDTAHKLNIMSEMNHAKVVDDLERARLNYEQAKQNHVLAQESTEFYDKSVALQSSSQQLVINAVQRRIDDLQIVSPVEGIVGNVSVNQKQAVTANQALITVVDLTAYEVEAAVTEGYSGELAPLMDVEIQLNGEGYAGVLTAISPEVINGVVTTRIRFAEELPPKLRQNQRLTARILLENKPDTLMVERGSFFENFRGHVFKLEDDWARKVPVVLGSTSLGHVEIADGLREGDTIITSSVPINKTHESILISD